MEHLKLERSKNDCGVRALAAACGVLYMEAWDALEAEGRKPGRWTYRSQLVKAAKTLGRKVQYNDSMAGVTVRRLGRELPAGNWIVHVKGHFLAVIDGEVIDWAEGRLFRVKYALKVT